MRQASRRPWLIVVVSTTASLFVMLVSLLVGTLTGRLSSLPLWIILAGIVVLIALAALLGILQKRLEATPETLVAAARENRQIMLSRVQNKWITGFLENPLYYSYDEQLLPLPLHERVGSRFDLVLSKLEPTQQMPSDTTLVQIFDQAGGELLILGEPGAGKTTKLLELARDLLKRAQDDEVAPIPVVLMLASWAARKLPLEQWITEELKVKYDIPSQIGQEWVKTNRLLPLLDGLDEVGPSSLTECIEAINAYYRQGHRSLVVCSRREEFVEQPRRLALHTAVIVQPLVSEQVDTYLDALTAKGEDVVGLKHVLSQSEELRALATTPLILTVLILAYHGKTVQELLALVKAMPTDKRHLIFHDYVERALQRGGTRVHTPAQQTKHWLVWLACQMTAHQQSELYLEQFQPDWLPKRQRAFYRWNMTLVFVLGGGLVFGLLVGLRYGLFAGLGVGLGGVLVFGLLIGLTFGLRDRLGVGLRFGLFIGLLIGLFAGLFAGLVFGLLIGLLFGLVVWLGGVLGGVLVFERVFRPRGSLIREIEPVESLTWSPKALSIWLSIGLFGGLFGGLFAGLVFVLGGRLVFGLGVGLDIGLVSWLVFGLGAGGVLGLTSGFSRKQLTERSMLSPNEGIRRSLINGLVFGLVGGLIGGLVGRLVFGPVFGLLGVLGGVLVVGSFIGLIFGLAATLRHYTLRFWLWQARCTPAPWRYVAFLDDAVEQLLLRKVGGGYLFRHGLLQDYFASLDNEPNGDPSV